MATSYTTLLGFAKPQTGDLSGTWGDVVNESVTQLVEDSVAGVATASVASGDWTLTTTGSGADNEQRMAIIRVTGSSGTTRNVIAPAKSKIYVVVNASTGPVVFKSSTSTGVTIAVGQTTMVAWNSASSSPDFVEVAPKSVNTATNLAGGGVGQVPYQTASGTTAMLAAGTATYVLTSNGTAAPSWQPPSTSGGTVTSVAALTLGTSGTDVSSTVANSTTTPVITLNLPTASATNRGALSSTDWSTFNGKYSTGGALGTPSSGTLSSCTVDGTNKVGYLKIPANGDYKFSAYTLVAGDSGKYVPLAGGGSIVVNNSVFTQGDVVTIFNNTSISATLTMNITTAYIGGTDTDRSSITLATRGIATILFIDNDFCVVTGNVS